MEPSGFLNRVKMPQYMKRMEPLSASEPSGPWQVVHSPSLARRLLPLPVRCERVPCDTLFYFSASTQCRLVILFFRPRAS